ncbi:helix-turn-helix transcriptional regulator [Mucilaginibacter sp. dw_454]|uniref:helix-turn-helix domain-containing protein n=1 Tax=Mucilaginibacter sp. dw_454 TaxID=2720079 RepID=UPI001BD4984C|nr:helix-turn-helix transcriptional regulator [Mucilaginibacter sp. dw_454]
MATIPMHLLQDRAEIGVEIDYFKPGDKADEVETLGAHRDDHYIFFLVESGSAELMIDFEVKQFTPGTLYFVLPGQVHHRISAEMAYGWFLAIDTGLLTNEQRQVFEQRLTLQQTIPLNEIDLAGYQQVLKSLFGHYSNNEDQPFYRQVLYSFIQAFTGMVAAQYKIQERGEGQVNRKQQLTQEFKALLSIHLKDIKSPSVYADKLNVSQVYLNEALKHTTGMPVSYWITQEVMLEAKRLLFYTDLNVKEIAYELGYEDHAYFSRLFKQNGGVTPLGFRGQYRE